MPDVRAAGSCCDRCTGGTAQDACRIARRRLLKAAVFQPVPGLRPAQPSAGPAPGPVGSDHLDAGQAPAQEPDAVQPEALPESPAGHDGAEWPADADSAGVGLPRAVTGRIVDVSPHLIVLGDSLGEQRFTLTADAAAWRGGRVEQSALQPGDLAVIRLHPLVRGVADRIWANIARVNGVIARRDRSTLLVDQGRVRGMQAVMIPPNAIGRVQVRFPNLHPGYLIDVIGTRRGDIVEALQPATSQPPYRSDRIPDPGLVSGHFPEAISGSATWHDTPGDPHGILGVSYPAIEPAAGCAEEAQRGPARGFRTMPYLAIGSVLQVRNECTGYACSLPVTGCAPAARLFNDRCLQCGTTERGRVAELTLASFVALGGELERGCFNATILVGR